MPSRCAQLLAMKLPEAKAPSARHLRRELADPRPWSARAVLVVYATASGLAVVLLNQLGELALKTFFQVAGMAAWLPLLWVPAATVVCLWLTRRYVPGAAGSGIPQVIAGMHRRLDPAERARFVSLRLSAGKLALTALGLLAGLSLGREGPSVQVAAGVMQAARGPLRRLRAVEGDALLAAGGAAGVAAAFNAPLAGVMFAIEELSRHPEQRRSGLVMGVIVFAGVLAIALQGDASYFGLIHAHEIGYALWPAAALVVIASGLGGGLFARLMVTASVSTGRSPTLALRARRPLLFAGLCGLAVAVLGVATHGATFGTGYHLSRALLAGDTSGTPGLVTLCKFLATWLTTLSLVPGGIFAPSLAIGASLGSDIARACGEGGSAALIALGMCGFLAAVTQAPMTSFIVVMEMVDGHGMVFSLMAGATGAASVSRLLGPSLYHTLARVQLRALRRLRVPTPGANS